MNSKVDPIKLIKTQEYTSKSDIETLHYTTMLNMYLFTENIVGLKNLCKKLISENSILHQIIATEEL